MLTKGAMRLSLAAMVVMSASDFGLGTASSALAAELNIYSYRQAFLTEPFIAKFEDETGTDIRIVYISKGILERLKAEGDNSPADLVMTVDIARLSALAEAGLLRPVTSGALSANIPPQYRGPDGLWYGLTTRARVIYYAKDRVAPGEISSYEDLALPQWKGRVCTRSGYHDYQLGLLASIIAHEGEESAAAWLAGVKANLARKPQGNDRAQVKAIKEGVCDVALGNTYYMGQMRRDPKQKAWAEAVAILFPNQNDRGTHVNISGVGMTKSAKSPEIALRFMEFLSSEAAQRLYARQNLEYPVKPGVAWDPEVESWGRFKADTVNLGSIADFRPAAVRIVDEVGYDN